MSQAAAAAPGERAVAVGGDVVDSVIVTGDNVNLRVYVGSEQGALLERLARSQMPRKHLRPLPLSGGPPPFRDHLDRSAESEALVRAGGGSPANLYGEAGLGKTYVLTAALALSGARALPDGFVYLFGKDKRLPDLLQELFESFYECEPPFKPSETQIRRDLDGREAFVVVDALELERDEAQALALAAPRSRFIFGSRERRLWEGEALPLEGLSSEDALALAEQELGRSLEGDERAAAVAICIALAGHPLRIRQAVAPVREEGRSLAEIAATVGTSEPARALTEAVLQGLSPQEEQLLRLLAAVGDGPLGSEHLARLSGNPDAAQALAELERRQLVESHSPRYSIGGDLAAAVRARWPLEQERERALSYFLEWAETNRSHLARQLEEWPTLQYLLRWGALRHPREAIRLGQAIDAALAWGRRWGAWQEATKAVLEAARRVRDRGAEAWALHQIGTHDFCVGEVEQAAAALSTALEIRRAVDDDEGAAATRHNLSVISGPDPPWFIRRIVHLPFISVLVIGLALVGSSGAGAWFWWNASRHNDRAPPNTTAALTVATEGKGSGTVASSPSGIDCSSTCSAAFRAGSRVTLTAKAAAGSVFVAWKVDGCADTGSCTVTMSANRSAYAIFAPTYTLTVRKSGSGFGTVTSSPSGIDCGSRCSAAFRADSQVILTAKAARGSVFVGWRVGGCPGTGSCTVTMSANRSAYAFFQPAYRLTVKKSGSGFGTVTSSPSGIDCGSTCSAAFRADSQVILTAKAAPGSVFVGWRVGGCPGTGSCTVTMSANRSAYAFFQPTYTLTVRKSGYGTVTSSPSGIDCGSTCSATFRAGSQVILTAKAAPGSVFVGWEVGGCPGTGSCTVTMSANRIASAIFRSD